MFEAVAADEAVTLIVGSHVLSALTALTAPSA